MQVPTIDHNILGVILSFLVLGTVTLGDFPEISRAWWSNLKTFLNTNLGNIISSLNTAIQSSEKGAASGVATLDADSKIPEAQLPNIAIIDIITSAEATLADYIANEWSTGSIQKGDAVQITLANGSVELWQLFQNDGDEEADYKKIDASKVDWSNLLNAPSSAIADIDSAVSLKHTQGTDQKLDEGGANEVAAADIKSAVDIAASDPVTTLAGVKIYRALLTQSGTNAPVATVLENSLGGTVVWTRTSIGVYAGTLAGAFPQDRTIINNCTYGNWKREYIDQDDDMFVQFKFSTSYTGNQVNVETGDNLDTSDDILNKTFIEILVYP